MVISSPLLAYSAMLTKMYVSRYTGGRLDPSHRGFQRPRQRRGVVDCLNEECKELTSNRFWAWYVLSEVFSIFSLMAVSMPYRNLDHGNEWCAREPTADVIFCFDKHSGYGGYGDHSWDFGVRNFVFKSPDPEASLDTWIRLESGVTRAQVVLDSNFDV